jgi:pectinesterase
MAGLLCQQFSCGVARRAGSYVVVAKDGSGNFSSIQEAIKSLPDSAASQRTIYIKKGEYQEKIFISKHQLKLEGEDAASTIITYPEAREIWRCNNPDDWGAAVMNLSGNDITLKRLSIINSYGFSNPKDTIISCIDAEGKTEARKVTKNSHQFALRTFQSTRLQAAECIFRCYAGDIVSPWNDTTGMYYFRDCLMEGGVDFYCPRGWAYAERIQFVCRSGTAAIWHDGSRDINSKSVIKNSVFTGAGSYKLGRYHRDAQIYLIRNTFSSAMADVPVYKAESSNGLQWGHRIYYSGNRKEGGDYDWFRDNLDQAPGSPAENDINIQWTFDGKWYPSEARK